MLNQGVAPGLEQGMIQGGGETLPMSGPIEEGM
jgi:hypothetical protein